MELEMRKEIKKFKDFLKENSEEKLNISDVRSRDFSDPIWDYLYNKWYFFNVNNIKKQYKDDSNRIKFISHYIYTQPL